MKCLQLKKERREEEREREKRLCSSCLSPGVPRGAPEQEARREELKKHPKHGAEEVRGTWDRRGALASPAQFAALAHFLETVFLDGSLSY